MSGFMLLEALVALAVVAMAFGLGLRAAPDALAAQGRARQTVAVAEAASGLMVMADAGALAEEGEGWSLAREALPGGGVGLQAVRLTMRGGMVVQGVVPAR